MVYPPFEPCLAFHQSAGVTHLKLDHQAVPRSTPCRNLVNPHLKLPKESQNLLGGKGLVRWPPITSLDLARQMQPPKDTKGIKYIREIGMRARIQAVLTDC